jgi:cell division protein FtsW
MGEFFSGVFPSMGVIGAMLLLVLIEPDKGTTLLIGTLAGCMWYLAGGRKLHLFCISVLFLAIMTVVIVNSPYAMKKIRGFVYSERLLSGAAYQGHQARLALASGGLTGQGLGEGLHKIRYIPDAHTDFIFAVVGEELGFIRTALLTCGFLILTLLGMRTAAHAADRFGYLLAAGATLLLGMQALINMGVVLNLLPNKGMTLPLISYGGSSIIVSLAAVGLIINVSRSAVPVRPRQRRGRA